MKKKDWIIFTLQPTLRDQFDFENSGWQNKLRTWKITFRRLSLCIGWISWKIVLVTAVHKIVLVTWKIVIGNRSPKWEQTFQTLISNYRNWLDDFTLLRVYSGPLFILFNKFAACSKPPSRDNHRKASYSKTQRDQSAGWTQVSCDQGSL